MNSSTASPIRCSKSLDQPRSLVGEVGERLHRVAGGLAGGVVAGDREQHEERRDLGVGEPGAFDLGVHQRAEQVVAGILDAVARSAPTPPGGDTSGSRQHLQRISAVEVNSGPPNAPVRRRRRPPDLRSRSGMPTMSDSVRTGNSLAQCPTKSTPLPASRSSVDDLLAFALIESSMRRTCRGVNAACTTLRISVCRGGSIARNDWEASSNSSGTFSKSTPLPDRKTSLLRLTVHDVGVAGDRPVAGVGRGPA